MGVEWATSGVDRHRQTMRALDRAARGIRPRPRWLRVLAFLFGAGA